jgi:hypothetical protein
MFGRDEVKCVMSYFLFYNELDLLKYRFNLLND